MKKLYTVILLVFGELVTLAQDQQFTQFYSLPTYTNPAFAGASVQSRLGMQYRKQWAAIPGGFNAANVAYDQYFPLIKSGIGFLVSHDDAGSGSLRSTSVNFQYAYEARIQRNWFFRPGLQFGYVSKTIDFDKLTFYDQMIREGDEPTLEVPTIGPVNYFDFGGGLLTYGPKFWLGVSAYHANTPNESLYLTNETHLARKVSVHGGLRLRIKGNSLTTLDHYLVLASNYQMQADFDVMDFGMYYEFTPVVLGVWYRGLPMKNNGYGYPNHDAVSMLLGVQASKYKFGYSYDITVSKLGIGSSAGSHEISVVYSWSNKHNERSKKVRIMPCVEF
ncbi:MAG: PorP/SprF family type IX secretion system membrane protein [Flavobacteriales bacterium]|nr:PorP/SprF family type IX secretion system membrane protein [Flavobacteriales bacterium]